MGWSWQRHWPRVGDLHRRNSRRHGWRSHMSNGRSQDPHPDRTRSRSRRPGKEDEETKKSHATISPQIDSDYHLITSTHAILSSKLLRPENSETSHLHFWPLDRSQASWTSLSGYGICRQGVTHYLPIRRSLRLVSRRRASRGLDGRAERHDVASVPEAAQMV